MEMVAKTYESGAVAVQALSHINFQIQENEYVAIMGPSGSGKSTLMNIIGCLDTPTRGHYYLGEKDIQSLSDNQLSEIRNQKIGFVFQSFNLLPRVSALKNVELPLLYLGVSPAERRSLAAEALERVGLGNRKRHRPNELSGGQRQRIAIARALVTRPALILADEPTGNLDSRTGEDIMALIQELHDQGNTVIMVTHEQYIAERAARVIRLKDGRIESDLPAVRT
ncbi:MAG: ABC transporter ATP-binding protein [Nitrospiria bacterium]